MQYGAFTDIALDVVHVRQQDAFCTSAAPHSGSGTMQARNCAAEADDARARLAEEAERAEDALAVCAKLAGEADRLQAEADSQRARADDSERRLLSAAADISHLETGLDRAEAAATAACRDRDAAQAELGRAEDDCSTLRSQLDELHGQTEEAAARSERQLYEVR